VAFGGAKNSAEELRGRAQGRVLLVATRLTSYGPEAVDRLSANRTPGVVAGQLELGQVLDHVAQSGAAHVRVALDGHDRKVAVRSMEWRMKWARLTDPQRRPCNAVNLLLQFLIAWIQLHVRGGHSLGL